MDTRCDEMFIVEVFSYHLRVVNSRDVGDEHKGNSARRR